uniref:Uncharacterized protein n=1 Tax=Ciona intestinalis TaxID=7719 RepID=H2XXV2_CIOIN
MHILHLTHVRTYCTSFKLFNWISNKKTQSVHSIFTIAVTPLVKKYNYSECAAGKICCFNLLCLNLHLKFGINDQKL